MSNVSSIGGTPASNGVDLGAAGGLSPDALLAYCQTQLGGLDGEIDNDIQQQNTQLKEREAVEQAQTALEQFGTTGPQDAVQFAECTQALDQAAASLPPGDPVATQLEAFKTSMSSQYGYTPGLDIKPLSQPMIQAEQTVQAAPPTILDGGVAKIIQYSNAKELVQSAGSLSNPPQNSDWQGTTDALGNIADGIKSDAEIQMLQLQDLVSQRQQAVQLASGMMSTEDQTLESVAKNIGG